MIRRKAVDIRKVKTLILDEADEMLSMGFKEDLNKILEYNTTKRNTWLFSATMSSEISKIVNNYMRADSIRIEVNKKSRIPKKL